MAQDIKTYVEELARAAKEASRPLGFASDEARQAAVRAELSWQGEPLAVTVEIQ